MDGLLEMLNERQKEAVVTTEGYVRVIAGAGSGKTRALTARYAYIVGELGIAPGRIMSVTFTNKAANEMKNRIRRMLGDVDTGFINTFHGFCLRVLKEDIHKLNYPQSFMVIDEEDQKHLLQEVYDELGLKLRDYTFKNILNIIGYHKASYDYVGQLVEPDEYKVTAYLNSFTADTKTRVLGRYLKKQRKNFMLDFDDIINFTLYLLTTDTETREKWQERLQYIQVDEFQDVDAKQAELVYLLSEKSGNLFVVGDPDQTIYSWRGADVSIILGFDQIFSNAKTIIMDTNYRSTPQILDVSNELIKRNSLRIDKALVPVKSDGEKTVFYHGKTSYDEAGFITSTIAGLRANGVKLHDIAILYRAHYLSRSLEEFFIRENIPYVLYNGVEFYRRKEIKDVICYLRMLISRDDISFLRTVNTPRRNIGRKRIAYLKDYAERNNCSLYEALNKSLGHELFSGHATKAPGYIELIERYSGKVDTLTVSDLLDEMLRDSGYEEMLMKNADQDRIDNVSELKNSIQEYENTAGEHVSLDDYLSKVALFSNIDKDDRKDSVKLMTIHTSKGLEFKYVFVCGMNEGIFPSRRKMTKQEMEEERRLAYVALTRAGDMLYLTDAEGINYDNSFRYPSRFVFDVDFDKYDVVGMDREEFLRQSKAAPPPAPSDTAEAFSPSYDLGDRVSHPVFGAGTLTGISDTGYSVQFDNLSGCREIDKLYGKLVKL